MSYRTEWDALAARIDGIAAAGDFLISTGQAVGADYYGVIGAQLLPNARRAYLALEAFLSDYRAVLPQRAQTAIADFIAQTRALFASEQATGFQGLQGLVAVLQSVSSEVSHLLADTQYQAYALVERAFAHLKRSIVVDEDLSRKWRSAFETHETHCERLGAVHLLSHGLWGFKASATGAATDLVLGHPVGSPVGGEASAAALVLTEWKRFLGGSLAGVLSAARTQAAKYSSGLLGGVELRTHRYIVVVSDEDLAMPQDVVAGDVVYRHVNVAVSPSVPSARPRRSRSGGSGVKARPRTAHRKARR